MQRHRNHCIDRRAVLLSQTLDQQRAEDTAVVKIALIFESAEQMAYRRFIAQWRDAAHEARRFDQAAAANAGVFERDAAMNAAEMDARQFVTTVGAQIARRAGAAAEGAMTRHSDLHFFHHIKSSRLSKSA